MKKSLPSASGLGILTSNVQAVRAAIEKMAEEGEVYTGVFTQVRTMKIMMYMWQVSSD